MVQSDNLKGFNCQQCGTCCRWEGAVLLTDADIVVLASALGIDEQRFVEEHTRLAPGRHGLALLDKEDGSCFFLEGNGCRLYEARPEQCRTFPYAWRVEEGCPALDECKGGTEIG